MDIIYRSNWNAKPNKGSLVRMVKVNKIVIHHAAGYRDGNTNSGDERVREIQKLHQNERRWNDIGYHFLIDSKGCIYQGRDFYNFEDDINNLPEFIHGAHVKHNNSDKIGICFLGCYHPNAGANCSDVLSEEAKDALIELCSFICNSYKLKSSDIKKHNDYRLTNCPGSNIENELTRLISEIDKNILLG